MSATDGPLLVTESDGGAVVRASLHRADKLNALNDDVRRALAELLGDLRDRPDVRVLLLSGEGRSFSAGADLTTSSYPTDTGGSWAAQRHRTGTWQRVLDDLAAIPQATVARLHRHVIGGAALLAAACDIRIAADDVVMRIPELAIGIPLTWAGIPLLVREVGLPLARDWVMTGRDVLPDELLRSGYAQRVVARAQLDAAVEECIGQLLGVGAGPLAMTRAMTSALSRGHPAMAAGWGDADHMRWSLTEDEYRAAVRAYVTGNLPKRG